MFRKSEVKFVNEGHDLPRDPDTLIEIMWNLKAAHRAEELTHKTIVESYEIRIKAYEETIKTLNETIETMREHRRS